jgi:hypothetical protein
MNLGDQVMVWGGPHHMRHGEIVEDHDVEIGAGGAVPSVNQLALVLEGGVSAGPVTPMYEPGRHRMVRFIGKSGQLLRRETAQGAPVDLVPVYRLAVFEPEEALA